MKPMRLGVNVDHVATVRQARGVSYPDPVVAAVLAEHAGCDSIVMHLREDARHIQERDIFAGKELLRIPLNLEMSIHPRIVRLAVSVRPAYATLVPENRKELTTEGGLDVVTHYAKVERVVKTLQSAGITVSLFIEPNIQHIRLAKKMGIETVELHTGSYANASSENVRQRTLLQLQKSAEYAQSCGCIVAAGHGLEYSNVKAIAAIPAIEELNIGHAIVSHAVYVGMIGAVQEMKALLQRTDHKGKKK